MSTKRQRQVGRLTGAFVGVVAAGCMEATPQLERETRSLGAEAGITSTCGGDALRPSAVPPAEGVWSFRAADGVRRVAVMLGPTELRSGRTVVTRTIEAIETNTGGERRSRADTAVVHLDLLPPYGSTAPRTVDDRSRPGQAAAIYAITPRLLIAAYESCSDAGAPAIRYLRRDDRGQIAVDAMLRR